MPKSKCIRKVKARERNTILIMSLGIWCRVARCLEEARKGDMTLGIKPELPEDMHREFVIQFLADLLRATADIVNPEAFQSALQTYCDSLRPWLEPSDCPPHPRAVFSLLEECTFDATGEHMTVVLSPEAEAFFCAWLRRNKIWSVAGLDTAHAWAN
jgi:hypothetical protein